MQLPELEQTIFETILGRRSVRSFKPRSVEPVVIKTLLEAAVWAPTAMHKEPWGFVIVQNKDILKKISDLAKPLFIEELKKFGTREDVLKHTDDNLFYDAGTLIIICGKTNGNLPIADCWMAAENMVLAACAMNLGSCVVASALPAMILPDVKAILGIPAGFTAIAPVIIGYPKAEAATSSRKAPLILKSIT
jgi:nitroreductase